MAETRQDSLLQIPRIIVAGLEHISAVIRLDHDSRATAEPFRNEGCDMTEIHYGRDFDALVRGGETKIIDCVVWNREGMEIDLADSEIFARFDLLHSIAQRFGAPAWFLGVDVESLAYVGVHRLARDVNGTID